MARETIKFFDISSGAKAYRIKNDIREFVKKKQPAPSITTSPSVSVGQVKLTFSSNITLSAASLDVTNWAVSTTSYPITITGIQVSGKDVILSTTEMRTGGIYTVNLPFGIKDSATGAFYIGSTVNFVGIGDPPTIVKSRVIDSTAFDIYFNEGVQTSDATNPANYVVTPPLAISSIAQLSPLQFRITTAKQSSVPYTVEINNIKDLAGNSIVDTTP